MTATFIAFGVLILVFLWFILGGRRSSRHEPPTDRDTNDDIDRAELEQAEREVQDASDDQSVRDWGPGATKPRRPEHL